MCLRPELSPVQATLPDLKASRVREDILWAVHFQMLTTCSLWVCLQLPVAPRNTWWASFAPEQHRGAINKPSFCSFSNRPALTLSGLLLLLFHHLKWLILPQSCLSMVLSQALCQNPAKDVPSAKLKRCAPTEQSQQLPIPKEIKIARRTQNQPSELQERLKCIYQKATFPYSKC